MKYFILVFLLNHSLFSYSQFFIGDSKNVVKSTLLKNKIKFTESKLTDTTSRISWLKENDFQMIWAFDANDNILRQTLISEKKNGINEFIKWFNKDFVIISPTEWRNYADGIIYEIKLENILSEHIFSISLLRNSQSFR